MSWVEKRSLAGSLLDDGRFFPVAVLGARAGSGDEGGADVLVDGGFTGRALGLRRLVAYWRLLRASQPRKDGAARSVEVTTRGTWISRQALHNSRLAGPLVWRALMRRAQAGDQDDGPRRWGCCRCSRKGTLPHGN